MNIKSSQKLVEEANKTIETLSPEEVKNSMEKNEITLIDVRILENFGEMVLLKIHNIFREECLNFG